MTLAATSHTRHHLKLGLFQLLLWLLLFMASAVRADNLVAVRSGSLPAPPSAAASAALAVVDGRVLAIAPPLAWLLDTDAAGWTAVPWPSAGAGALLGTAGNGKISFVLSGSGERVEQVAQVVLAEARPSLRPSLQPSLQPSLRPLPPLPTALSLGRGAVQGSTLFIAGLDAKGATAVWRIDTAAPAPVWSALPGWPAGAPGSLVAQTKALYVTVAGAAGAADALYRWNVDEGWTARPPVPGQVIAGAARATGQAHMLYLVRPGVGASGATGASSTSGAPATPAPASPMSPMSLMSLHTITGSWALQSGLANLAAPAAPDIGAVAPWKDGMLWASRGATLPFVQIESGKLLLQWLDWIVIVVYLVSMLGMGLYFYLREKRNSTADFFVGGRSIPFWAAGVSLYAANTSSISYIAIPAKAFETNWQYMMNNLVAVLGLMFVATWIVPLLRRLDLMSVFSYLETRFHPAIRMLSSALCILVQLGSRMSVILFLPALAIATITGIDVVWSILMMGGFTIVYTALGGMKAVVWTDIVQLVVKMGGALFAIGFMIYGLNGGWSEFVSVAAADEKTKLLDFSFDLTKATVWGFIFLVVFDVVLTFPKDQVLMQRTLSTKNEKDAGRSIWIFALITIPGGIIFYTIGTALYVYYKAHPERMNPLLSIDATFPLFIAAELPMGITGLIVAGIFAAAMATLSSIINSVSTLASVDFYEKLVKNPTQKKSVLFAELMTVAAGLVGMGIALLLSRYDIHSLFDVSIELAGLLGGGFAGAYTLGMFTRRANSPGVAIGIASAIVLTTTAWTMNLVHPYFYLAISILLCIVIGYIASLFFPAPTRSLKGLTIYSD